MLFIEFTLDDIKSNNEGVTTGYKALDDLVYDIALGIVGNQILDKDSSVLLKDKKKFKQPKNNLT